MSYSIQHLKETAEIVSKINPDDCEKCGKELVGVRTRGLWAGVDIDPGIGTGRMVCEALMARGVLAKDTHGSTIRLAPPLVISSEDLLWGLDQLADVVIR